MKQEMEYSDQQHISFLVNSENIRSNLLQNQKTILVLSETDKTKWKNTFPHIKACVQQPC